MHLLRQMKSTSKLKKLKITVSILFGVIILGCITIYILFYNEINTLLSIRKINNKPAYKMTYHGNYALEEYLNTGAKDWNEVLNFLNENLGRGVGKYIYGKNQCSSFLAKTPDGDYILARNLDTEEAIPSIINTNSMNSYKTIGVTDLRRGGWNESNPISKLTVISSPYYTLDGMNEYGLSVASSSVPVSSGPIKNDSKITIHDTTVNRVIIDKARNVDEAIELLTKFNIKMEETYPSHYMIADSEGNSAVIEYINGDMKVTKKTGNYQIATNFILYDNKELVGYSSDRYMAFDRALSKTNGIISVDDALALLERNVVPGEAQWSVVYNLSKKTMAIEFYNDYNNTYYFSVDDM